MCCFWDCCTSDCYLHGLVLQAIWQFSWGHLALSKKGDSHNDWHLLSVRWNWGQFHRVLLLIAFFRFQLFLLRVILLLKVRRGFYMLVGGIVTNIVFCLLRSWCHKVILLFASHQCPDSGQNLSKLWIFWGFNWTSGWDSLKWTSIKDLCTWFFNKKMKILPWIFILLLNSEPKNIITVQSYLVLVLKFWISVRKHKAEVVKSIPLCPLYQEGRISQWNAKICEDFMNPELEKLCPISEQSGLWWGSACQQLSNRLIKCLLKYGESSGLSERTKSYPLNAYLQRQWVLWVSHDRGLCSCLLCQGFSSKACNTSGALQNHVPLHPHSSHSPLMLRKRYGDIISAKASLSSLVTIVLPLPTRIFIALRSLWNHPLAGSFFIPLAMDNVMYSLRKSSEGSRDKVNEIS